MSSSLSAKTTICAIIGNPVEYSLSPAMHNAGYAHLGLDYCYVGFQVAPTDVAPAVAGIRSLGIRGTSVTVPHKTAVIPYLDEIDPLAQRIGAVNTIVNTNGILKGHNTDWQGAILALEEKTSIAGKNVILLGAGGTTRAIGFGLIEKKAKTVTLLNRTPEKAQQLATELGAHYGHLTDLPKSLKNTDILINTTPVGMQDTINTSLVPKEHLHQGLTVLDAVYVPARTQLLQDAESAGANVIYGYRMLLWQGVVQFTLFTGVNQAPTEVMEKVLEKNSMRPHNSLIDDTTKKNYAESDR